MHYEIHVENIKCGGCANSISTKLTAIDGVDSVDVDIDNGIVKVEAETGLHNTIADKLLAMGYPEAGSAEGIAAAKAKAKSFVSCAVGRLKSE